MTQTLPVSRLINVQIDLSPLPAQAQSLSDLLVLGSSNVIDVTERLRTYATLADVAVDFGTSAAEYLAAVLWFEQAPQPTQLKIGRWAKTATAGKLVGGALSVAQQLMSAWTPVTTPRFFVYLNGVPYSIAPASFAAQTNLNGVAALIQTALAAALASTTCVWNATYQRFEITSGTTGGSSTVSFLTPPTATGTFVFAGQPADTNKITLNGTDVVFAAAPTTGKVTIGVDLPTTLSNLLTFLQASVDVQVLKFTYVVIGSTLYVTAAATGAGGDSLTISRVGANITASGATLSGGTGTDISAMLAGLVTSSGAYAAPGQAAETAVACVALMDDKFGQQWYATSIVAAPLDADHLACAAYIEGSNNKHLYGVSTQEAGVLSSVSTTDIAYLLSLLGYNRTVTQYSSSNAYSVCSLLGRILTVDYNGNNTTITLMYKQEPGIVAEALSATQVNALEAKSCNVFVAYNNDTAIIEQGKVASGDFLDTITGSDWLAVTTMTALYNLLYTSTTKVPQTDAGNNLLVNAIEAQCSQGVINGLLAPGTWTATGFGTLKSGDYLPKGFYVYAPPVASQNPADRAARKSVTIQVAAKLAGAIHTVFVILNFNR